MVESVKSVEAQRGPSYPVAAIVVIHPLCPLFKRCVLGDGTPGREFADNVLIERRCLRHRAREANCRRLRETVEWVHEKARIDREVAAVRVRVLDRYISAAKRQKIP
jgi:hypothetical protein